MTALHIACQNGSEDLACLLIDKSDMKVLAYSQNENSPLHLACSNKKESKLIVKRLLDRIKNEEPSELSYMLNKLNKEKQSIMNIAIENNHINIIDILLKDYYAAKEKESEDKNGNFLIHLVAKSGSTEILKVFIKNEAVSFNKNSKGDTALHIAAENNKFNFIKDFLAYEKAYVLFLIKSFLRLIILIHMFLKIYFINTNVYFHQLNY